MLLPLLIFAATYVVVAGQRIPGLRLDRPSGAFCGAVLMVVAGGLTLREAFAAIDMHTIGLLLGMMLVSGYLLEAAFFRTVAFEAATRARSARALLVGLVFVSGLLSAVLVNDVVCVMFTPVVLAVVRSAKLSPAPYLVGLATASNIGGVATLTGNPQNMLIGASSGLSYARFVARMAPVALLGLAIDAAILLWLFRDDLPAGPLPRPDVERPPFDRVLAFKAVGALSIVVVGFLAGYSMAGMALVGAALLILAARRAPRPVLERVDWPLLVFFSGLFVVIAGAAKTGALDRAHTAFAPFLGETAESQLVAFGLFTQVASNVFSNVPFVLLARNWVPKLVSPEYQWTGLAMTSTLAGNLTIVGSVANLIVFELAGQDCKMSFLRFLKYGVPITLATTAVGFGVLLLEMRLGW